MRTVWKYEVGPGRTTLKMPIGSQVLCVQMQGDSLCLWSLVNTTERMTNRDFLVYGTGHEIPDPSSFERL